MFVSATRTLFSSDGKAGRKHVAIVARLVVEKPVDLVRRRPMWKKIPGSDYDDILEYVNLGSDKEMWTRLRSGLDPLPMSRGCVSRCPFWTPNLQRIGSTLNCQRQIRTKFPVVYNDYSVIR